MTKAPLPSIAETSGYGGSSSGTLTSIKDAYCEWLRDVDALTRKRKSKKKSKRLAALRQLTQPTTSSAQKQFQAPEVDDVSAATADEVAESRRDVQRRQFQSLADEANYAYFTYTPPWAPSLAFFAVLATQAESRLAATPHHASSHCKDVTRREFANFPLRVPPTVLRRQRGIVVFFTVEQPREPEEIHGSIKPRRSTTEAAVDWTLQFHYITTTDMFESRLSWVLRLLTGYVGGVRSSTMAVLKTADSGGNHVRILDSLSAIEEGLRSLWMDCEHRGDGCAAVQAYVDSKGSLSGNDGKAWIARPAYRKRDQAATTVWILTGSDSLVATTEWEAGKPPPCHIVKCTTAQSWQEPRVIVETLCQWLDTYVLRPGGVGTFAELVVDLVQDTQGFWWLLQVKAFQLRRSLLLPPTTERDKSLRAKSAPDRLETVSVSSMSRKKAKWKCAGVYCYTRDLDDPFDNQAHNADAPSGFLTKKEVLSCAFFDSFQTSKDASLSGGCGSFSSALRFYVQHRLSKRDRTVLYEPQALCSACIQRYSALRAAMASLIEAEGEHDSKRPAPRRKLAILKPTKSLAALPLVARLPAVQLSPLELRTSQSTPEISSGVSIRPSYMDDVERMENLLADTRPLQPSHHCESHSLEPLKVYCTELPVEDAASAKATTFSWQETASKGNRVDEMWDAIQLKPIATNAHAYNTFSLHKALREAAATPSSPRHHEQNATNNSTSDPHVISVVDCRRVFSDEAFRDSLVHETIDRLLVHRQPVRFVVMPTDDHDGGTCQDLALGRMALRTVALDVDQSLAREGVSIARGLPSVNSDALGTGCLFMTVPVPPC